MSKPTATEYSRAIELGEQARRATHSADRNPYRHGNTDKDRLLAEAWQNGYERQDQARKRR